MTQASVTPRATTFIASPRLNAFLGVDITLASETLQYTGSFKFRGAFNVARHTPHAHIIAASSGNFGQALAFACRLHGKRCTIVMPHDSAKVKVEAVRAYGAEVEFVDTTVTPRAARVAELLAAHPGAVQAHPSDGELMLSGNETLGIEVLSHAPAFDTVVAPIGSGGVVVGLIRAVRRTGRPAAIVAAEPLVANDVARSLREGRRILLEREPTTLADGVRVLGLSAENWEAVRDGCSGVVEVAEPQIAEATKLLFELANLKAEPTGALSLGAVLTAPDRFAGRRVCCIVTGGNVDPAVYVRILKDGFGLTC
jgi:threonine dehydratase